MIQSTAPSPSDEQNRSLRGEQLSILYRDIDGVFAGKRESQGVAQPIGADERFYKSLASSALYSPRQGLSRVH